MEQLQGEKITINPYKRVIGDITRESIIRFQIIFHCYFHNIYITPAKLKCLTILGMEGKCELSKFCDLMKEKEVFLSVESTRNTLTDIQIEGLILKSGKYRKVIELHPDMKIQTTGNIWVDIDMLYRELV